MKSLRLLQNLNPKGVGQLASDKADRTGHPSPNQGEGDFLATVTALDATTAGPGTGEPAENTGETSNPDETGKKPRSGLKHLAWQVARVGVVLLVLGLMIWALYQNRADLWQALREADWGWLLVALALNLAGSLIYVMVWESCARQLQAEGKWGGTLIAMSMAGAARYIPGGIWPVAGLVYFAPEIGLPRRQVPVLALLSQLVHLVAAGLASVLGFGVLAVLVPGVGIFPLWLAAMAGLIFGVGAIILLPRYLAPLFPSLADQIRRVRLTRTALYSLLFWLVNGVRIWVMTLAFAPVGGGLLPYLVCAGAITTILSAVFFFVPLGLGIVEFSLSWWLAQVLPFHLVLAVVALNRLLRTLNDFLYFGVSLALVRLRRRGD